MPARRSNATILLQKVNTQLHGERVPLRSKEEDELAAYLNTLTQRSQQVRDVDISTSSGADSKHSGFIDRRSVSPVLPTPTSRFLKKKPQPGVTGATGSSGTDGVTGKKTENRPVLSGGNKEASCQPRSAKEVDAAPESGKSGRYQLVSRDSQSEVSFTESDLGHRPDTAKSGVGPDTAKSGVGPETLHLLKNQNIQYHERKPGLHSPLAQTSYQEKELQQKKDEIARTLGSHFVPSDQDSLTEFIQGLSTSELSARRPQNLVTKKQQKWRQRTSSSVSHSPSPVLESRSQSPLRQSRSPFGKLSQSASQDSDMVNSLASEMHDGRPGSNNSDHLFQINLTDVASLLPSLPSPPPPLPRAHAKRVDTHSKNMTQKHKSSSVKFRSPSTECVALHQKQKPVPSKSSPKKKESSSSLFDALGIHMADELLSIDADSNREDHLGSSEESEIKTQSLNEHKKMLKVSESSIITDISHEHKRASEAEQNSLKTNVRRTSKTLPVNDVTDVSEYSESFNSESSTGTPSVTQRSRDNRSKTHSTKKESKRSQDCKVVMEELLVDVSATNVKGSTRRWNTTQTDIHVSAPYGVQYVDPAPVARHVVSSDALQALTAYSPNMLALQEMMKVQLELVQNFLAIQQRIYQSCMEGFKYDYKYTTLEETREFIRTNQKPRLTFKEALQLVQQDKAFTT
ncbi:unnamed protein product [Candidula unifasciata]|uniref:DUF4614 domain-containing protein n=1 Tax=Candidula unifasciata TaxID=100452 RepID=A0A8S3YLL1_9EUPU|nr:unnamed protein product [Candidula unifasciata]